MSQLLSHKYEYIQSLWQFNHEKSVFASNQSSVRGSQIGSMLSGSSSITPKIRNNAETITEEEI